MSETIRIGIIGAKPDRGQASISHVPAIDATVYSSTAAFGDVVAAGDVYLEKPETAMNLVTIQASHTMDPAAALVGGLDSLFALATVRYPEVAVAGEDPPSNAPAPTTCSSAHAPRVAVC